MKQAAQGSDRVTIPRNIQNTCGCDTWGYDLAVNIVVLD